MNNIDNIVRVWYIVGYMDQLQDKPADWINKLTPKQRAFGVHYVAVGTPTCNNPAAAARAAGYSNREVSSTAHRLLRYAHIRTYIRTLIDNRDKRSRMSRNDAIAEARRQYDKSCEAGSPSGAWFDRITQLEGLQVIKTETEHTVKIVRDEDSDEIERLRVSKAGAIDTVTPVITT